MRHLMPRLNQGLTFWLLVIFAQVSLAGFTNPLDVTLDIVPEDYTIAVNPTNNPSSLFSPYTMPVNVIVRSAGRLVDDGIQVSLQVDNFRSGMVLAATDVGTTPGNLTATAPTQGGQARFFFNSMSRPGLVTLRASTSSQSRSFIKETIIEVVGTDSGAPGFGSLTTLEIRPERVDLPTNPNNDPANLFRPYTMAIVVQATREGRPVPNGTVVDIVLNNPRSGSFTDPFSSEASSLIGQSTAQSLTLGGRALFYFTSRSVPGEVQLTATLTPVDEAPITQNSTIRIVGADSGSTGPSSVTLTITAARSRIPVNYSQEGGSPLRPYTTEITVQAVDTATNTPVLNGTEVQLALSGLNLGFLNRPTTGDEEGAFTDEDGNPQGFPALPSTFQSGIATYFFTALSTPGTATVIASMQDPLTGRALSASTQIEVIGVPRDVAAITLTGPYVQAIREGRSSFGADLPRDGVYSRVISALATDANGNPVLPNTPIHFFTIDAPLLDYPASPGRFLIAGENGDPVEGDRLFTAQGAEFITKITRIGDRLVLDGTKTVRPDNRLHSGIRAIEDILDENRLRIRSTQPTFNITPRDHGPTVPYIVGRSEHATILSPSYTNVLGRADTLLTYPIFRVGQTAVIAACTEDRSVCDVLNTCDASGANCRPAYLSATDGTDHVLTISTTEIEGLGEEPTPVRVCLRDRNFVPVAQEEIRYQVGETGVAVVTINDSEDSAGILRTGPDGCVTVNISVAEQVARTPNIPIVFTTPFAANSVTVRIRAPGALSLNGTVSCDRSVVDAYLDAVRNGNTDAVPPRYVPCVFNLRVVNDLGRPVREVVVYHDVTGTVPGRVTYDPAFGNSGITNEQGEVQARVEFATGGNSTVTFRIEGSDVTFTYTLNAELPDPPALSDLTLNGTTTCDRSAVDAYLEQIAAGNVNATPPRFIRCTFSLRVIDDRRQTVSGVVIFHTITGTVPGPVTYNPAFGPFGITNAQGSNTVQVDFTVGGSSTITFNLEGGGSFSYTLDAALPVPEPGEGPPRDPSRPPSVVFTVPQDGARDIDPRAPITIGFSEPIDVNTFTLASIAIVDTTNNEIFRMSAPAVQGNAGNVFRLEHLGNGEFVLGRTYRVTISPGVRDLDGQTLTQPFVFSFTIANTDDENEPPFVEFSIPIDGDSGVSTISNIVIRFSESVDPFTMNLGSVRVFQVTGTGDAVFNMGGVVPLDGDLNRTFEIQLPTATDPISGETFTVPFAAGGTFSVVVTTAVRDIAGANLDQRDRPGSDPNSPRQYRATFTTSGSPNVARPPCLVFSIPQDGSVGVDVSAQPVIRFSKPMDPLTVNLASVSITTNVGEVFPMGGVSSAGGVNETFIVLHIPDGAFARGQTYRVRVSTSVRDQNGVSLNPNPDPILDPNCVPFRLNAAGLPFFEFTTSSAGDPNAPPQVLFTIPQDGAINVPVNASITVRFDKPMDLLTVTGTSVGITEITGDINAPTYVFDAPEVNANGDTFVFRLLNDAFLRPFRRYRVIVTNSVRDTLGQPLPQPYIFEFTTTQDALGPVSADRLQASDVVCSAVTRACSLRLLALNLQGREVIDSLPIPGVLISHQTVSGATPLVVYNPASGAFGLTGITGETFVILDFSSVPPRSRVVVRFSNLLPHRGETEVIFTAP